MRRNHITGDDNFDDIPIVETLKDIPDKIEELSPSDVLTASDRNRPYNGQPWTDTGKRGKQEINGVTMRDIRDCFIRACYDSNTHEEIPASIYDIDFNEVDILTVCQNMICWIEKYMGIYPNIPDSMKHTRFDERVIVTGRKGILT